MLQSHGRFKKFLHFSNLEGGAEIFTRTGRRNSWLRLCRCNTPSQLLLETFHHPANPLYPIFLLSNALSTPVTTHLKFSNRAIFITAPRIWNYLPPELRTFSVSITIIEKSRIKGLIWSITPLVISSRTHISCLSLSSLFLLSLKLHPP